MPSRFSHGYIVRPDVLSALALVAAATPAAARQVHDRAAPPAAEEPAPAIDLTLGYTGEVWTNVRGGASGGGAYLDNLDLTLTVDAERAWGWRGATLFAYGLYNNGASIADRVGAAQGVSNIEAGVRAARLYEAWVDQRFAGGRASVRAGLYDLNSEFDVVGPASLFLNPSHGIGADFAQSGRGGPSIFPNTSLGLRGEYRLSEATLLRAAALDGVPGDPDRPRRTAVRLGGGDGALLVAEANHARGGTRIGAGYWRYTARFDRVQGGGGEVGGNDGAYLFAERRLTRSGLSGWARVGIADARINPVARYAGAGLVHAGPFRSRDDDQAGVAIAVAAFGGPYRRAGASVTPREIILEATYRARVASWLTVQPDVQYVIDPGGRRDAPDALAVGLRVETGF